MDADFISLVLIGFVAQLIDGALGMAFGLISTSAMLTIGMSPAHASALVHTAEIFTTGASAVSHIYHRNVDWKLVLRLGVAGVIGAIIGAWLVSNVDGAMVKPFVAAYLFAIGLYVLYRAFVGAPQRTAPPAFAPPLGLVGGFLDASGGGGWGPVVTTTLIGSGHAPRTSVGSVNASEFFVTLAATATFFVALGGVPLLQLSALVLGGVAAAPLGGWVAKHVPARALMISVGVLVLGLSGYQLARSMAII